MGRERGKSVLSFFFFFLLLLIFFGREKGGCLPFPFFPLGSSYVWQNENEKLHLFYNVYEFTVVVRHCFALLAYPEDYGFLNSGVSIAGCLAFCCHGSCFLFIVSGSPIDSLATATHCGRGSWNGIIGCETSE